MLEHVCCFRAPQEQRMESTMKSLWPTMVQINSIHSKANACSALVPTGWERLKEVTLLSFHWHSLLFLHKALKALVSKACLSPCSVWWKLSDVPVFAEGDRQGSTVTLIAGGAWPHAGQSCLLRSARKVQWCCCECKNEHSEKGMAQYSQKYCVFQARQLYMEYDATAVNGNRAKADSHAYYVFLTGFTPASLWMSCRILCTTAWEYYTFDYISNHYYQCLSSGCTASRIWSSFIAVIWMGFFFGYTLGLSMVTTLLPA